MTLPESQRPLHKRALRAAMNAVGLLLLGIVNACERSIALTVDITDWIHCACHRARR